MKLIITDGNGETHQIAVAGSVSDMAATVAAHGFDPDEVEYSIKKGHGGRLTALEQGTGVGGGGQQRIAHRIDDLEQRVSDLEDEV